MSRYIYERMIDTVVDAEVLRIIETGTGTIWDFHFEIGEPNDLRTDLLGILNNEKWRLLSAILANYVPVKKGRRVEEIDANSLYPDVMQCFANEVDRLKRKFNATHGTGANEERSNNVSPDEFLEDYFAIKHVNFKGDSTIVIWKDGSKTSVTCQNEDIYSKEVGIAMCVMKRAYERMGKNGGKSGFNDVLKNVINKQEEEERKRKLKENKKFKKQHCKSEENTVEEKAKTVGVSTDIELSEAWCHDDRIRTRRNYISIKFVYKEDGTFKSARVTDYLSKIQYDIFECKDAAYIKRLIKSKDYKTARFWLCNHFTTPEVML